MTKITFEPTQALPQVYIFTHDSVGVGEDGPTHQPVETVASMRLMPNMDGTPGPFVAFVPCTSQSLSSHSSC